MTTASLLTDQVRSFLHQKASYTAPEPMGRSAFRYFARAVGDDNPLYDDVEFARAAGYRDVIAPPTLICETNQYVDRPRDEDGYIGHTWNLPLEGCRQVRGGNSYEFFQPLYPDDVVRADWEITAMEERTSGGGHPMLVVTSVARYSNQYGDLLATNTETLIYMGRRTAQTAVPTPAGDKGQG